MDALCNFLSDVQDTRCGGFQKCMGAHSDPMHTCMALTGLSILTHDDDNNAPSARQDAERRRSLSQLLQPVHPALNVPMSAYVHLRSLHKSWSSPVRPVADSC